MQLAKTKTGPFEERRKQFGAYAAQVGSKLNELRKIQAQSRAETERRSRFASAYGTLADLVAHACHEIVLERNRDEWSLAYAFLANYALGHLAASELSGARDVRNAMLANLSTLSREGMAAMPSRKFTLGAWDSALAAFGPAAEPEPAPDPHPYVDSFAQAVRLLRDTGPRLKGLSEFYAASPKGVHVVRT